MHTHKHKHKHTHTHTHTHGSHMTQKHARYTRYKYRCLKSIFTVAWLWMYSDRVFAAITSWSITSVWWKPTSGNSFERWSRNNKHTHRKKKDLKACHRNYCENERLMNKFNVHNDGKEKNNKRHRLPQPRGQRDFFLRAGAGRACTLRAAKKRSN